jgi:hypothetical protein
VSVNVSAPIKVFALVGLLAALVLGGGMMFLGRGTTDVDAAPAVLPTKKKAGIADAPAAAKKVAAKADAAVKKPLAKKTSPASTNAKATATPKPAATKKKAVAAPAKPKEYRGIATNGLPMQIAVALRSEDVVVVALWGTGGKIDALSRDEARAGAKAAGAGFVALNVIDHAREAEALTLQLGTLLRAPAVLVFTRPKSVANRLDGFRDRESVAQAALDALR